MLNKVEEDRLLFVEQMESFLQQQMLSEAMSVAEERLSQFPLDADALVYMHLLLLEMGKIDAALNILKLLEEETTRLSHIYLRIADTCREKGLDFDAISCYQKCLALNPNSASVAEISEKISLLQGKKSLTAVPDETEGSVLPKPEFYTITLAELYIQQGHLNMAATIMKEIIKRDPANAQARTKLEALQAAITQKTGSAENLIVTDNMIKTLSCWLENIGRLKMHVS